jgi:hypothetical protein
MPNLSKTYEVKPEQSKPFVVIPAVLYGIPSNPSTVSSKVDCAADTLPKPILKNKTRLKTRATIFFNCLSPSGAYEVSWRVRLKVPYDPCLARSIHPVWFPRFPKKWEIRHEIFGFLMLVLVIRHKHRNSSFSMRFALKICKIIRKKTKKSPFCKGIDQYELISAILLFLTVHFGR